MRPTWPSEGARDHATYQAKGAGDNTADSKVRQHSHPLICHQHVVGFEVQYDNVAVMQLAQPPAYVASDVQSFVDGKLPARLSGHEVSKGALLIQSDE
jgi:hypothetical protein